MYQQDKIKILRNDSNLFSSKILFGVFKINNYLDFEKPLIELRAKVSELKNLMSETNVDLTDKIISFEQRILNLENETYNNLTPWQRVAISRHPKRPTTLDFIPLLFENFIELHGDRFFGDEKAICRWHS